MDACADGVVYTCGTGFDGYAGQLETTRSRGHVRPPNEQGELGRRTPPLTAILPGAAVPPLTHLLFRCVGGSATGRLDAGHAAPDSS